jgi:heme/copper-type cytochrome/quinol oxidase subunit 2
LLTASDVIHAWWVPELTGKKDAIPGQKSVVNQTSMSATIRSILSQGGKILSIAKA